MRYQLSQLDFASGHLEAAKAALEGLLKEVSAEADPVLHARILHGLGGVSFLVRDYGAVERANEWVIATLAHMDAPRELGQGFEGRGIARSMMGKDEEALADFARARVAFARAGDDRAIAILDANLGVLNTNRGRFAEALPELQRAVDRLRAYGVSGAELRALDGIAYCNTYLLDPNAGLAIEARRNELQAKAAEPNLRYHESAIWSQVLEANGRLREAQELLDKARAGAMEANDEADVAVTHAIAAKWALRDDDLAGAAQHAEMALKAHRWDSDNRDMVLAWLALVRAYVRQGASKAAVERQQAVKDWAAQSQLPLIQMYASLAEAEIAVAAGSNEAAAAAYGRALELADRNRVPFDLLQVAQSYAGWLIWTGNLPQAGSVIGRVAGWAEQDYGAALLQVRLYHALGDSAAWQHALAAARNLAGERQIPAELLQLEPR